MSIDWGAFAVEAMEDGRLLVRTRCFADGTFTAALSPPLWDAYGEPVEPPPIEEWPVGLYGADGFLIVAAQDGDAG